MTKNNSSGHFDIKYKIYIMFCVYLIQLIAGGTFSNVQFDMMVHVAPHLLGFILGEGLPVSIQEPDGLILVGFASLFI